jgi:hypothetical protein
VPAIHSSSGSTAFNEGVTLLCSEPAFRGRRSRSFRAKNTAKSRVVSHLGCEGAEVQICPSRPFFISLRCHRHMLDPRSQKRDPSTSLRAGPGAPSSLTPQTWQPACHFVRSPKKSSDERRSFVSVESDPRSFQFLPGRASLVHNAASFTTGKPSQLRKQLESPAVTDRGRLRL